MDGRFQPDDEVWWTDPSPEGKDETPELYKVKEQLTDDGPFSIYLVYNEFSEAEVYEKELS